MTTEEIRVFRAPYISQVGTPWLIQGGWRTDSGVVGVEQWVFAFDPASKQERTPARRAMRAKETAVASLALTIDLTWMLEEGVRVAEVDLQVMIDEIHKGRLAGPKLEQVGKEALIQLAVRSESRKLLRTIYARVQACDNLKRLLNEICDMQTIAEE